MDLGTFFQNLANTAKEWGNYFIIFLGVILLIVAVTLMVIKFMTHGQGGGRTSWFMLIAMILVGGFLMVSGFNGVTKFADIGTATLEQMADG